MTDTTTAPPAVSPPRWPLPIIASAIRDLHATGGRHRLIRFGRDRMHFWAHPNGTEITLHSTKVTVTDPADLKATLVGVSAGHIVAILAVLRVLPSAYLGEISAEELS